MLALHMGYKPGKRKSWRRKTQDVIVMLGKKIKKSDIQESNFTKVGGNIHSVGQGQTNKQIPVSESYQR